MKLGVVGLPNVGKSTLFNAITKAGAESANYPFCTIEPNVGVVAVPDKRLDALAKLYNSKKITPTYLEFVDIAGLVKGASRGEGLGNKFLSHIREVDAITHVVRCFDDDNITHVDGSVNPLRDIETINLELIFADMESVSKRIAKARSSAKGGDKKFVAEAEFLEKIYAHLESGKPVRSMQFDDEQAVAVKEMFLLTTKPVIYVANISEGEIGTENDYVKQVKEFAKGDNAGVVVLCAKIEEDLASIDDEEERNMFAEELGLSESGLDILVTECYSLLGLISYLTAGEKETRAWTIEKGTKAPQILLELGSYTIAKEKGKVRSEGKDYVVQDGDVVLFRFNV